MNGLSFFLGSSDPAAFKNINGYFYAPVLMTNGGSMVEGHADTLFGITITDLIFLSTADEMDAWYADNVPAAI